MPYLVEGSAKPDSSALDTFYDQAKTALSEPLPDDYHVRWIGANHASTEAIMSHVISGAKTGTVSLPWVAEQQGLAAPKPGDCFILIHFDGTPALLMRLVKVETVAYKDIGPEHTVLDGPQVRAMDVWMPLHTRFFENLLKPYGLQVTDDMPIWFETFEVLYRNPDDE